MAFLAIDTPVRCDMRIAHGQDYEFHIQLQDAEEQAVDLSGCTLSSVIRERQDRSAKKIADFTVDYSPESLSSGIMVLRLTKEQIAKIWHKEGWYDLKIVTASGNPYYYLYGRIEFIRTVS